MRLFYDFEHDEFLTEKDLVKFFNLMTEEEKEEYDNNLNHYIECCMNYNNGCCIPIEDLEEELKSKITKTSIDIFSIHDIENTVIMLREMYEFIEKNDK